MTSLICVGLALPTPLTLHLSGTWPMCCSNPFMGLGYNTKHSLYTMYSTVLCILWEASCQTPTDQILMSFPEDRSSVLYSQKTPSTSKQCKFTSYSGSVNSWMMDTMCAQKQRNMYFHKDNPILSRSWVSN